MGLMSITEFILCKLSMNVVLSFRAKKKNLSLSKKRTHTGRVDTIYRPERCRKGPAKYKLLYSATRKFPHKIFPAITHLHMFTFA